VERDRRTNVKGETPMDNVITLSQELKERHPKRHPEIDEIRKSAVTSVNLN
jgi:hypothetical protein